MNVWNVTRCKGKFNKITLATGLEPIREPLGTLWDLSGDLRYASAPIREPLSTLRGLYVNH